MLDKDDLCFLWALQRSPRQFGVAASSFISLRYRRSFLFGHMVFLESEEEIDSIFFSSVFEINQEPIFSLKLYWRRLYVQMDFKSKDCTLAGSQYNFRS